MVKPLIVLVAGIMLIGSPEQTKKTEHPAGKVEKFLDGIYLPAPPGYNAGTRLYVEFWAKNDSTAVEITRKYLVCRGKIESLPWEIYDHETHILYLDPDHDSIWDVHRNISGRVISSENMPKCEREVFA